VLVTVFLAGLLPGAWAGGRFAGNRRRALMTGDLLLCMLLVLFGVILLVARQGMPAVVLYGFGLAVSFCCGFQFPLALMVSGDSNAAAAQSFSADLVGAAIGVLLVSLVLIPFLGLLWATLCLAGIKLISFLVAGTIHETA
jgi:spermidine synthase